MEGNAENQRKIAERYATVAREYLKAKGVLRYRMKKIAEMSDQEVMRACHFWYEENGLAADYRAFEAQRLGN